MAKNEKKSGARKNAGNILMFVGFVLVGAASGFFMAQWADRSSLDAGDALPKFIILLLALYAMIFLQIVLHEAGHLVFGLLTGYKFCSFRIGSIMLIKQGGKLRLCRYSLAGTGGQCLLAPPDYNNGDFPVALYNLGGPLMNLITVFIFGGLYFAVDKASIFSILFIMMALVGLFFAITNGIPLRGAVDNDGRNALSLRKDKPAASAIWKQLAINARQAEGDRLRDINPDWFTYPEENLDNSLVFAIAAANSSRLLDMGDIEGAEKDLLKLLDSDRKIPDLYKVMLNCDLISCRLLLGRDPELGSIMTKEQETFMKAMKNYPSILRTRYLIAKHHDKDEKAAGKYLSTLEGLKKSYPNGGELESELELCAMEPVSVCEL